MTSETWPVADVRLERRYRRLLLAYSGRYRRDHGTEIVTTLLEMAEPEQRRPSAGDAWHLVRSGIRQRFRLPSGRPFALVAAVLITVTTAVFGAAAGSWAGERTFAELPGGDTVDQVVRASVAHPVGFSRGDYHWHAPGNADWILISALPEEQSPGPAPTWVVEQARDGLAAAGWRITRFEVHPMLAMSSPSTADPQADLLCCASVGEDAEDALPLTKYQDRRRWAIINAERDGVVVHLTASDAIGGDTSDPHTKTYAGGIDGKMFAARSAAYLPLIIVGALLGGVIGWLLAAAGSYRVRPMGPARRVTTALLTGATLAAGALPVFAIVKNATMLAAHFGPDQPVYTPHSVLRGDWWYLLSLPGDAVPRCATIAAVAGLLALLSTWGRAPRATESAALPS